MRTYRFYKDDVGWFIDLPEWEGEKNELQMIMGADTFLDMLSQGENNINLIIDKKPFKDCEVLYYQHEGNLEGPECGEGAWYFLNEYMGIQLNMKIWLCDVTKFVFEEFPLKIYFK
jgi:hypothetical protein